MKARIIFLVGAVVLAVGCSKGGIEDPELRRELLEMRHADQAERTGEAVGSVESDRTRTQRLKEIIEEYGWPTREMVGRDGASAAWLIAQHSDFDGSFQERALRFMKQAEAEGQADPIDVAYLEDRVAVNRGEPQTYGSQIRCEGGEVVPATPIRDEGSVDGRRREVGMEPLKDYFAELEEACAAEATAT